MMIRSRAAFLTTIGIGLLLLSDPGCGKPEQDPNPQSAGNGTKPRRSNKDRGLGLGIQQEPFSETAEGRKIDQYLLTNAHGMTVSVINYGAIVTSVVVPDRDGNFGNVTLGFETLKEYEQNSPYFGAICGRYANRIAGGKFLIGKTAYTLVTNDGPNHIHGGKLGFNKAVWDAHPFNRQDVVGVELTYVSPDGEEGYPGELRTTVSYTLNDRNELRIDYTAVSTKATPVNLTNHCYWNLARDGNVLEHQLMLNCNRYLPVDETLIPTGELRSVQGTPMDFTSPRTIGSRMAETQGGYDHCYVMSDDDRALKQIARVDEPQSGRVMEVLTTEPGVQLYTGNFLDGTDGSGGYEKHQGFCLECQHFPDSPNQSHFPNTILQPGEVYKQTTVYRFSVEK